jgi:hypothetical protein
MNELILNELILNELIAIRSLIQAQANIMSSFFGVKPNPFPWPKVSVLSVFESATPQANPDDELSGSSSSLTPTEDLARDGVGK